MRYVLVAIFVCAVGVPAASALPRVSPNSLSLSKAELVAQPVKRARPHARRQSRGASGGAGGIHPLVGSGDY